MGKWQHMDTLSDPTPTFFDISGNLSEPMGKLPRLFAIVS